MIRSRILTFVFLASIFLIERGSFADGLFTLPADSNVRLEIEANVMNNEPTEGLRELNTFLIELWLKSTGQNITYYDYFLLNQRSVLLYYLPENIKARAKAKELITYLNNKFRKITVIEKVATTNISFEIDRSGLSGKVSLKLPEKHVIIVSFTRSEKRDNNISATPKKKSLHKASYKKHVIQPLIKPECEEKEVELVSLRFVNKQKYAIPGEYIEIQGKAKGTGSCGNSLSYLKVQVYPDKDRDSAIEAILIRSEPGSKLYRGSVLVPVKWSNAREIRVYHIYSFRGDKIKLKQ